MDLFGPAFGSANFLTAPSLFETPEQRLLREQLERQQASASAPLDPLVRESLLNQIGGSLASGAAYVGGALDKTFGGRTARYVAEALGGGDDGHVSELLAFIPGSDTFGLTNRENEVTGEDLTEWNDPNSYIDNVVNFGVEAALDPSLFLTLGTGASLTAGGKLLRSAGVSASQIAQIAAAKRLADATAAGTSAAAKAPGHFASQVGTTLNDVLRGTSDSTFATIQRTADRQGVDLSDSSILNEPVAGLFGVGLPFRDPSLVFGNGQIGQSVAGALDSVGSSIYNAFPGKNPLPYARALFDSRVRGTVSPEVQPYAARSHQAEDEAFYNANLKVADLYRRMKQSKFFEGENGLKNQLDFVSYLEKAPRSDGLALPDDVRSVADEMRFEYDRMLADERKAGLVSPELADVIDVPDPNSPTGFSQRRLSYMARLPHQFSDAPPHSFASTRPVDTTNPFATHREDFLRGMPEGTAFVQELSIDPEISGLVARSKARNGVVPPSTRQEIEALIRRKYGPQFEEVFDAAIGQNVRREIPGSNRLGTFANKPNEMRELVGFLATLDPRHAKLKQPFFADPVQSFHARLIASNRALAHSNVAHDAILENMRRSDLETFKEPTRDIWRTFEAFPGVDAARMSRRFVDSLRERAQQTGTLPEFEAMLAAGAQGIDEARALREGLDAARKDMRQIPQGLLDPNGNLVGQLSPELQEYVDLALDHQRLKPVLSAYVMPRRLTDDMTSMLSNWQTPPAVGFLEDASRRALNAFKIFNTSAFPAFHVRNAVSGQFNNAAAGAYTGPGDFFSDVNIADAVMEGRTIPGIAKAFEAQFGPGKTDAEMMDVLRNHVFAGRLLDMGSSLGQADVGGSASPRMLDILSTSNPLTPFGGFKSDPTRTWWQAIDPSAVRGVRTAGDLNAYIRGMNQAGTYIEGQNRIAPFIGFLKQGIEPIEAARRARTAQVDYSDFSDFEKRVMTQVAPFYKFTRGMAPFVADQLLSHPGGLMAQAVRGTGRLQRDAGFVPESVGSTTALPLGENEDGSQKWFTGFGLAYEQPLNLIRPGVDSFDTAQNVFGGLMSMVNPYVKAPVELAANTQFFSGRQLTDLDSTLGRIGSNIGITEEPASVPIVVDELLANSPASRALNFTRQATDSRQWDIGGAANLLTGFKTTNVDPERAERDLARAAIEKILDSNPNVRFSRPELYASDLSLLSEEETFLYRLLQELLGESRSRTTHLEDRR